jgi:hypothetical protein
VQACACTHPLLHPLTAVLQVLAHYLVRAMPWHYVMSTRSGHTVMHSHSYLTSCLVWLFGICWPSYSIMPCICSPTGAAVRSSASGAHLPSIKSYYGIMLCVHSDMVVATCHSASSTTLAPVELYHGIKSCICSQAIRPCCSAMLSLCHTSAFAQGSNTLGSVVVALSAAPASLTLTVSRAEA